MVSRINPCNPDALRLLLSDRLPPVAVGELEDHLQRCPSCRRVLDDMAGGESWWSAVRESLSGPDDPDPVTDADPLDFLAPSEQPDSLGRVGPYEVKGVLGRGGNGVVLKAFDPGLNRFVAVKVIASVLAGSGAARKRFAREAQAAAAVVHEHVVAVYAVDEAGGLPYLVMEYVAGKSLQSRLDTQGPLGLKEILRIAVQTAAGLAAAHAQGLVHRDIKPANILLENGVERVKITDFGLARAVADATLTQSGVITGTPHYMAPEQARGDGIDHRADLFSLGSTMYAMCTGHPPFRAETPLAVLRRVTDEAPRPVRAENPDIPAWLERLIAKLMAKDPADRFQTAGEVCHLLEQCLAHVQSPLTAALPAAVREPSPPVWQRRRVRWAVGAGMAASLAGLTAALALAPPGALRVGQVGQPADDGPPLPIKSGINPSPGGGWAYYPKEQLEQFLSTLRDPNDPADGGADVVLTWHALLDAAKATGQMVDAISYLAQVLRDRAARLEAVIRATAAHRRSDDRITEAVAELRARARSLEHELTPAHPNR